MQLSQIAFRDLQPHLICRHIKISLLIRYTICKSLVKIQHFGHDWIVVNYTSKFSKKRQNQKAFYNFRSHQTCRSIEMSVFIRYTHSIWKFGEDIYYQTQMPFIVVIFFFRNRDVCQVFLEQFELIVGTLRIRLFRFQPPQ